MDDAAGNRPLLLVPTAGVSILMKSRADCTAEVITASHCRVGEGGVSCQFGSLPCARHSSVCSEERAEWERDLSRLTRHAMFQCRGRDYTRSLIVL